MRKKIEYEQIVLTVYSSIESILEQLEKSVKRKAVNAFSSTKGAFTDCNELVEMIETRNKMLVFKATVDKVFERLSDEERILFGYKYFNNRIIDGFDYKSRNYFRKQNKALNHLGELLGYIGLCEKKFYDLYGNLKCVKSVLSALRNSKSVEDTDFVKELFG